MEDFCDIEEFSEIISAWSLQTLGTKTKQSGWQRFW